MLEFTLLAEGMRKLGLIWLLIQNGTLGNSSVLFWDEPETNLNPKLYGDVIEHAPESAKKWRASVPGHARLRDPQRVRSPSET